MPTRSDGRDWEVREDPMVGVDGVDVEGANGCGLGKHIDYP